MPSDIGEKAAELFHEWLTQQAAFRHKVVALLDAIPRDLDRRKSVDKSGAKFSSPCQALVNGLFEEASIFHGQSHKSRDRLG